MITSPLQHLSARLFSRLRHRLAEVAVWAKKQPRLAPWVFVEAGLDQEERYRDFNGRYFADFYEQERMLADQPRMRFYHTAINRHIQPGDWVIDLGTGTGILAAFASRAGAGKVFAIDHSEILAQAKTIAAHNRVENVEFVATHSTKFTLSERVDVIVHEQMGDCLFDESMVANVADLRDRLLKPGGLILPSCFELYCEPIKVKDERVVPFLWEMNVHGYDYSCTERDRPQESSYYHRSSSDLGFVDHFLGAPEPILSVDLHTLNPSDLPKEIQFTRTVVNAGRLDGYAVFFKARVDHDLVLSSSPLDSGRAPHWGFRVLRTDRDQFAIGDEIEVKLTVGCWTDLDTWRWSHVKRREADLPALHA